MTHEKGITDAAAEKGEEIKYGTDLQSRPVEQKNGTITE